METAGYLFFWFLAQVAAFAAGFATHYAQAFLSMPDKIIDGFRWRDHALNSALNDRYLWWADYDEQGFWEFYSLKNFLLHVAPASLLTFLFAIAWFPERAEIVAKVCRAVAKVGIVPLFCP